MKKHLNTLFVTLEGCWLSKDGDTVKVNAEGTCLLRVPLHNLEGIVTLGWDIGVSPYLMGACAERGITLSFCNPYGKFLAGVQGFMKGNILLRREQYRWADDEARWVGVAREMIGAKIANCRSLLLRAQRTYGKDLSEAIDRLAAFCRMARGCNSGDMLRGIEGSAAETYFSCLSHCQRTEDPELVFESRNRRPPKDCFNALLSFLYSLLCHDARSALESSGIDAAAGFLHRDRPGRPGMALDLMEEFRAPLADRLALTLINRKQISSDDFDKEESGAVFLKEDSRKKVLNAWQERKKTVLVHPFLQEKTTLGLLIHIQALLLARHLRGGSGLLPSVHRQVKRAVVMYILITYDVATDDKAGQRRLRQVARACENVGQRVQNSVFECELPPAQLVDIRNKLLKIIDSESDSLRIYHMGSNWHHKIEQLGKEKSYDISGPLII